MNFTIKEMCKTTGQVPPESIADKTLDELATGGGGGGGDTPPATAVGYAWKRVADGQSESETVLILKSSTCPATLKSGDAFDATVAAFRVSAGSGKYKQTLRKGAIVPVSDAQSGVVISDFVYTKNSNTKFTITYTEKIGEEEAVNVSLVYTYYNTIWNIA